MKTKILIHLFAGLCITGGFIWGIVEGLLYFLKDKPVNWIFLLPLICGIVIAFLNIYSMMKDTKPKHEW